MVSFTVVALLLIVAYTTSVSYVPSRTSLPLILTPSVHPEEPTEQRPHAFSPPRSSSYDTCPFADCNYPSSLLPSWASLTAHLRHIHSRVDFPDGAAERLTLNRCSGCLGYFRGNMRAHRCPVEKKQRGPHQQAAPTQQPAAPARCAPLPCEPVIP